MEAIMMPVAVLGITGVLMGLFLAYASKKFEVEVDPKVEAILAILPGANCGARRRNRSAWRRVAARSVGPWA